MKLLREINDKDAGTGAEERFDKPYQLRKAVRAVLLNDKQQVALINVSKNKYHKLPGGGVDEGESLEQALKREVMEEVGYEMELKEGIGVIVEYRNDNDRLQISYCYIADVTGGDGVNNLEQDEIDDGFQTMWVDIDEAIKLLEQDKPEEYNGKFIVIRDLAIIKEAKQILG